MTTLAFADRVQEYAMNVAQGTVTLLGASAPNLRTFASAGLNGQTVPYVILHRTSNQWEIGYGVYTQAGAALTRVAVLSNSLGTTTLVPFLAGEVDVWNDLPASKIVALDADTNNLTLPGGLTTPTTTASTFGVVTATRLTAGPVTIGTGVSGAGSIGTQGPVLGLVVQGISGTQSDLTLMTASGATALRVVAGTPPSVVVPGPLTAQAGLTVTGTVAATTLTGALAWPNVTGTPTTLAGYGITDAQSATGPVAWSRITATPTTIAGYGITDAYTKAQADARYVQSVTGTAARIAIGGTATAPTVNIDPAYVGQASITTLGTVATGTWQATPIGVAYGGTGLASYSVGALLYASAATTLAALAIGTAGQVLNVTGGLPTWHTLTAADVGALTQTAADARYAPIAGPFPWAGVTGRPTTLAGYGITDAVQVGTITAPMVGAGTFPAGTFGFVGPVTHLDATSTATTTLDVRNTNASFAGTVVNIQPTVQTSSVNALNVSLPSVGGVPFTVRGDGIVIVGQDTGSGLLRVRPPVPGFGDSNIILNVAGQTAVACSPVAGQYALSLGNANATLTTGAFIGFQITGGVWIADFHTDSNGNFVINAQGGRSIGVSGQLTVMQSPLVFTAQGSMTATPSAIGWDASVGLMVNAAAGTVADFRLMSAGGQTALQMAHGSNALTINNTCTFGTGLVITPSGGGSQVPGNIQGSSSYGLTFSLTTGSLYDFAILNPAGSAWILRVPTGTNRVAFGGMVTFVGAAGGGTAGAMSADSSGTWIQASTGAANDFTLYDRSGTYGVLTVPAGTRNAVFGSSGATVNVTVTGQLQFSVAQPGWGTIPDGAIGRTANNGLNLSAIAGVTYDFQVVTPGGGSALNIMATPHGTNNVQFGGAIAVWGAPGPSSKPVVSGAKGGNAALGSLLGVLANYGLVTDSTTA